MMIRIFSLLLTLLFISQPLYAVKVGLLIMATGKYIQFVPPLVQSAKKHFLKGDDVTFYVFTDQPFTPMENVVTIYQKRLGWPKDTLMRYEAYYNNQEYFAEEDYLFACDADMLFVNTVGREILGNRVATIHPGFYNKRGSYETNPNSKAYVSEKEGAHYYCGGFYGGKFSDFIKILETNISNINDDLSRGLIAVWHDESHWNRYCIDNPPTKILSPSYCYPESWSLPFPKKLIALDKNHKEMRE